jgi:hypothetical protein
MKRTHVFPLLALLVAAPARGASTGLRPRRPATEAVLETDAGEIVIRLLPELAPRT